MKIGRTEMIDESRRIMGLAWPVVLTSLNWTLLHLTDVIVVGLTGTGEVAALGNFGLRAIPSQANFLLILFEGALTAEAAYLGLMERGYIVRWLPGQGLAQALRITIGTQEDMEGVADALRTMARAAG